MSNDVKLVDIAQLNTLQEAYMLKAKLESEGVQPLFLMNTWAQLCPYLATLLKVTGYKYI